MNLIINLDHDEWILSDHDKTLAEIGAGESTFAIHRLGTIPDYGLP
jgi:hypothetical protein